MKVPTLLVLASGLALAQSETPKSNYWDNLSQATFDLPLYAKDEPPHYVFKHPIQKVAIIGAGGGGLITAREFRAAGYDIRVFERDTVPGGVWHYTDETPDPAHYRHVSPKIADFEPRLPPSHVQLPYEELDDGFKATFEERKRSHRAPRPLWRNLESNGAAPIQQISEMPWPANTPWQRDHFDLARYVRSFASFHGLNSNDDSNEICYNTRVELVKKVGDKWVLTLSHLSRHGEHGTKTRWWTEEFDAVVVASGRYNAPKISPIPGLAEWHDRWPNQIIHSREYRFPETYDNKTVLIIGVAVSGTEMARDLVKNAKTKRVYQSVREKQATNSTINHPLFSRKVQLRRIPPEAVVIGEIEKFLPPTSHDMSDGKVLLKNGTVIHGIDQVIMGTGFVYTFPFLPHLHNDTIKQEEAETEVAPVVTDGTHLRSLFLDLVYISDPTLAFLDMGDLAGDFVFAEYQSLALAKVWKGMATLPTESVMWKLYKESVADRGGYSSNFQLLDPPRLNGMYRYFTGWLHMSAARYGGKQIELPPAYRMEVARYWLSNRFGSDIFDDF